MNAATSLNYLAAISAIIVLSLLSIGRLRRSSQWHATVTPLASIIGSGFLIVAPLLHAILGKWALAGMIILSLISYGIGAVIRFNIRHTEAYIKQYSHSNIARLESISQWILGLAYAISVAFYTTLFMAFVFNKFAIVDPQLMRWATTALLLTVMTVAWWRGAKGLEMIELIAVMLKLAIIGGVLLTLATYDVMTGTAWFQHNPMQSLSFRDTVATLAGMLMVTQGFETARFMGTYYSVEVRINAVRYSQWIAIIIYAVFIGVTCPIFLTFPIVELTETTISQTLGKAVIILPLMLLVAATASQLSAALADTIGGGGLFRELVPVRIPSNFFYMLVVGIAIGIIWSANIFDIINYASKGFAAYYLLQVLIAIGMQRIVIDSGVNRSSLIGLYSLVVILLFVVFGSISAPHS